MAAPLVTIIDDVLPEVMARQLTRAIRGLRGERLRAGYQTTFWYELGTPPTNVVEQAVVLLQRKAKLRAVGVEWWLSRMKTSNVRVDFHRDRDNAYFARTGKERHPRRSSVLYLTRCVGGLLAVTPDSPNPRNPALAPTRHDFDFVEPRPNRLVHFDGRLTHGVLDATNSIPGRAVAPQRRWRLGVVVNWWQRRPEAVPTYSDTAHYRGLAAPSPER